jgi:hypothetical protein
MEAFQLLARGGTFNKSRFKSDVKLFTVRVSLELWTHPQALIQAGHRKVCEL